MGAFLCLSADIGCELSHIGPCVFVSDGIGDSLSHSEPCMSACLFVCVLCYRVSIESVCSVCVVVSVCSTV